MNEKLCKAKSLRRNATDTERFLWEFLRSNRLAKFKFRRQVPLGPYIVDFVCQKQRVIVECDGGQHAQRQKTYDDERDQWLKIEGYRVLRFWNNQILKEHEAVLQVIYEACADTPHPTLSPKGRGG
ncbi:MAG: endonuclease domain-containing protein [Chlamydiae bacterium]|nr:endonuclease domain-containing protein [Chlamydiota bacterium]